MRLRRLIAVALLLLGAGRTPACLAAPQVHGGCRPSAGGRCGARRVAPWRHGRGCRDCRADGIGRRRAAGFGPGRRRASCCHYDGATGAMTVYDGRETAPAGRHAHDVPRSQLASRSASARRRLSGISVGVPGALAMLELAHKEQGKLAWNELFTPAIAVAREGFAVSPRLAAWIQRIPLLRNDPDIRTTYFNADSSPKKVGDRGEQSRTRRDHAADRRSRRAGFLPGCHRGRDGGGAFTTMCGPAPCRSPTSRITGRSSARRCAVPIESGSSAACRRPHRAASPSCRCSS